MNIRYILLLYHLLIRYIIFVGNRNGIRTDIKIIYLIIYYYMYEGSIQYIYMI